ncbi:MULTISPECIES: DUF397 domain-containing protein [unclassified Streptomyces]|uniref:DUF397 domain-containing protein n=1 Tax=unclassified Streptomyces TaxID=2593676 RepID=UPI00364E8C7A
MDHARPDVDAVHGEPEGAAPNAYALIKDASTLSCWRKSSYSNNGGGSCVEVLDNYPSGIPVRDSKTPHGPALVFPAGSWSEFVAAVKEGELPTAELPGDTSGRPVPVSQQGPPS